MLAVPYDADQWWTESVLHNRLSKDHKVALGGLWVERQEVPETADYAVSRMWPCAWKGVDDNEDSRWRQGRAGVPSSEVCCSRSKETRNGNAVASSKQRVKIHVRIEAIWRCITSLSEVVQVKDVGIDHIILLSTTLYMGYQS